MVNTAMILDEIRNARARQLHWEKLVGALRQLETTGLSDSQGRAWPKVLAELTGYTVNQIRQMQRTLVTLEGLQAHEKNINLSSLISSIPYSQLEILGRIAKLDPNAALKYLRPSSLPNRWPTYRELREQFYKLRDEAPQQTSAIAAGLRTSREFEKLCFSLLKKDDAERLYRPLNILRRNRRVTRWPGGFRYANPNFLIEVHRDSGKSRIDAVDCFAVYGDLAQEETIRRLRRVAFEASFFSIYWIMLPTWSPLGLFESECKTLELKNVGIVEVDLQRQSVASVAPPQGSPLPDRRKILDEDFQRIRKLVKAY